MPQLTAPSAHLPMAAPQASPRGGAGAVFAQRQSIQPLLSLQAEAQATGARDAMTLPDGWYQAVTGEGIPYFHNLAGQVRWELSQPNDGASAFEPVQSEYGTRTFLFEEDTPLGFQVALRDEQLYIEAVAPGMQAERLGVLVDAQVTGVNGRALPAQEIWEVLSSQGKQRPLVLSVYVAPTEAEGSGSAAVEAAADEVALPDGWYRAGTPDGTPYYHNENGEVVWELSDLPKMECH